MGLQHVRQLPEVAILAAAAKTGLVSWVVVVLMLSSIAGNFLSAALAKAIAIGEPDELLRRRPDVRSAERRLAATTAREAVAAADLYPHITVTGFLGLLAGRGNLFGHPSPEVIRRLEAIHAEIFRTDRDGAVILETNGDAIEMTTMAGRRRVFVTGARP